MKKFILMALITVLSHSVLAVEYNKVPKNMKCLKDLGITICRETDRENPKYYEEYESVVSCTKAALFDLTNGKEEYTYLKTLGLAKGKFSKSSATALARNKMRELEKFYLKKLPSCSTLFKK